MAKTGLLNPIYAPIISEPQNAPIVYGEGKIFAKAISASITYSSSDNPLYADNAVAENDNSITGMEVTLGVDEIPMEDLPALLGTMTTTDGEDTVYQDAGTSAPYVGVGYIQVKTRNGVTGYTANWIHKVQFNRPDEETSTKGESIEWQTDTITGTGLGAYIDNSGMPYFRARVSHTGEGAYDKALAWLKKMANISE